MLVRSNHARPLKTVKSKRKVPLVEALTPAERLIVDEVMRRWTNQHRLGTNGPLLAGVTKSTFRGRRGDIGELLRALIRAITGSPCSTLHLLRHSFATRIGLREAGYGVWQA